MDLLVVDKCSVRRANSLVLQDLSLTLRAGEWLGVLGPNGAGKSTLLSAIGGLIPYAGSIRIAGDEIRDLSKRALAQRIAFVRQSAPLLFDFTVEELVLLGLNPTRSLLSIATREDRDLAAATLESVDLGGFQKRSVMQLSGGERQRVFLAQALLQRPSLLLLDEPTAHLDVHHQYSFMDLVRDRVESGLTVVSAFHDLELSSRYASQLCVLDRGLMQRIGSPRDVVTEDLIREVFRMNAIRTETNDGHLSFHFTSPN